MPHYDEARGLLRSVVPDAAHLATSKATPVDADELPLVDSAASFTLKKLTWANLKATLATWIAGNLIPASFTTLAASGAATLTGGVFNTPAPQVSTTTYAWNVGTPVVHFAVASSCTVTLLSPVTFAGMTIMLNTYTAQSVVSASANVVDLTGNVVSTILAATIGKWCILQSDGTWWRMVAAN